VLQQIPDSIAIVRTGLRSGHPNDMLRVDKELLRSLSREGRRRLSSFHTAVTQNAMNHSSWLVEFTYF
jgi:hypothetical protein